jgi:chemotaxis protein MotB
MKPWHKVERKGASPIWLTVFSDMSTNLMLFFLLLFAMTRMSAAEQEMVREGMESTIANKTTRKKVITEHNLKLQQEREAIERLDDTITYGELRKHAEINVDNDAIKITLNLPVFFASGSEKLQQDALQALERLVMPLREFPNDIIIEGHTDNVPVRHTAFRSNWELSIARAVSVINFFTERGLNKHKLIAAGYGEYHPVFPNDSAGHKARNRRIEVTIVRPPREPL